MRKSTLITTIAMIVVVVVALSTATFAWFTSSTVNEATQTISTTATGDLLLSTGTIQESGTIQFSPATAQTMTIDTAFNGLYSPRAALERIVDSAKADGTKIVTMTNPAVAATTKDEFVNADITASGVIYRGSIKKDPLLISVLNSTAEAKDVYLTIVIDLGTSTTDNTKVAAAALSFDIYATRGGAVTGDTATYTRYTNGYNYATNSDPLTTDTTELTSHSTGVAFTADNLKYGPTGTGALTTKLTPDDTLNGTSWITTATDSNSSTEKITPGTSLLIYRIKLSGDTKLAGAQRINISLYSWMDGWLATDSARNASVKVNYIFGTTDYTA